MSSGKKRKAESARPGTPAVSSGRPGFPVVGIGASAGGLAAVESFLSGIPKDSATGMAFVLVQHLAPDHKSLMVELIRRYTRMEVMEAENGMAIRPDCAYIIPPNRDMAIFNGSLQLFEPSAPRGQRLPIDFFFRSLAQDQKDRAVCVVLSGTGSDGTLGVRAVKGEGGLVIAQSPASAEYDGMPRSAIATGMVDYELEPARMAARILDYVSRAFRSGFPPEAMGPKTESALKKIFTVLRSQTGHDFSNYKPSTVNRRIERRMAVQRVGTLDEYLLLLQGNPPEVQALFNDLLIGVTRFFRDTEAFKALEELAVPQLFKDRSLDDTLRVWVPGCSTGEEAYSIAILLFERMEALKQNFRVQVFATDIDPRAVAVARAGSYPYSIAADISPERLARFFTSEPGGETYRVVKGLRDMLVFSEQDLVKDPPFSRLDLISCRNLLIYMGPELQRKLVPLFHYALNPGGFLFLGTSESIGDFSSMFHAPERKAKIYQRKPESLREPGPSLGRILPSFAAAGAEKPRPAVRALSRAPSIREVAERALLDRTAPAAALVDGGGEILYLHGRFGIYLEPPPGEAAPGNILKMSREDLRLELTTALHKTASSGEPVRRPGLRVKIKGDTGGVDLAVFPVKADSIAVKVFLVTIAEAHLSAATQAVPEGARGLQLDELKAQLLAKEEYLQASNEELQTANEELQSANEELQSMNEEMQSANEELETSKEELQSLNEELSTVNAELQAKVTDLSRANNDLSNLLAGTGIATVFVDRSLRILRFNPAATRIINLIAGDVGRPIGHIVSNLAGYDGVARDAQTVLDTLVPKEMEVQTLEGGWYSMNIRPYRTMDNVIEGVVLTFVDVTKAKKDREAAGEADILRRQAAVVLDSRDAVIAHAKDGRILAWNPRAAALYGWSEAEALSMNVRDLFPAEERGGALALLRGLAEAKKPGVMRRLTKDGRVLDVNVMAVPLLDRAGESYAVSTTETEMTG